MRARALRWAVAALVGLTAVAVDTGPFASTGHVSASAPAFQMLDNGKLRFGGNPTDDCYWGCASPSTPEASLSAIGLLKQPFYYSAADSSWYKLTFWTYPLNLAIGTGTGGSNWSGAIVSDITSLDNLTVDTSGFVSTGSAGTGEKGYGALEATGTTTINGQLFRITNRSELGATDSYVKITTTITNISGSPAAHTTMWVGTQDDYVGTSDQPTKTKGNIVDGVFEATSAASDPASALLIESGPEGVLFYSTTPGTNASIDHCCDFSNAYDVNPTSSPRTLTGDGSYTMNLPVADLADGASTSIVWFYAAGATADLADVISQVGAAAQPTAPVVTPGNHQASVSWTAPASTDPITDYIVRYRPHGSTGAWTEIRKGNATAPLGLDITGLTNGTEYEIQLAAVTGTSPSEVIGSYSASALVNPGIPVNTVLPTISGSATVGATLSVVDPDGNWTSVDGTSMTTTYQWQAEGVDIPGAISSTFVVTPSQIGSHLRLVVTRTNTAGATHVTTAATTAVPAVAAPGQPGAATVTPGNASATVGWTAGTATDPITSHRIRYRPTGSSTWTTVDTGALSAPLSYHLTGLTNGTEYEVQVAAASGVAPYFVVGPYAPIVTVLPGNPVVTGSPTVSGDPYVASVLTAVDPDGNWTSVDGTPLQATYRWQADGVDIPGATSSTFVVTPAQVGAHLRVIVTRTNASGTATATSAATAVVPAVYLSGLGLTEPAVTPAFDPTHTSYRATVGSGVTSLDVAPVAPDGATVTFTLNGVSVAGPAASLPLVVGDNTIVVTVTRDGVSVSYTIVVTRPSPMPSFHTTTPTRLLDTRSTPGPTGRGQLRQLTVAGVAGVPADATSAVLNVTVAGADGPGFVTVYPCGEKRPWASNLNYAAGQTISNAVVAKIGTDGQVCIYSTAGAEVVVDVSGFFRVGVGDKYLPITPARLVDTRETGAPVGDGQVLEVTVAGRAGLPADVTAAALNVTVTEPTGAGFVTVYPCGTERPLASNLNYVAGQTVSNAAVAQVGTDGKVCVYVQTATHVVVDVNGAYTPSGPALQQSFSPFRLIDTREGGDPVGSGRVLEVTVAGVGEIPADAAAVVLNLTVVDPAGDGFATVYPCGTERPWASNINYVAHVTVPNAVIAKVGTGGKVCVFLQSQAHVVIDVNGAMTVV